MTSKTNMLTTIAFIVLLFTILSSSAVVYDVGVKAGDWARYDVAVTWQSSDVSILEPDFLKNYEEYDWFRVTVQDVQDKTITAEQMIHLNNGTENSENIEGDISIGSGGISAFFIAKDLDEGDLVPGFWTGSKINETISGEYAGLTRDINYLGQHFTDSDQMLRVDGGYYGPFEITTKFDYYFDKETGILCKMSYTMSAENSTDAINLSFSYSILETNLWGLPPPIWTQWWLWVIVAAIVVVPAVVVLVLKMRKKPKPIIIAPPPPPEKRPA